jgi:hypothetical protein
MRRHQILSGAAALAIWLGADAFAAAQGTDRQREACTPDVFRLCGAYIPDADRITACLRGNGARLSRPCYDVFFPPQENLRDNLQDNLQQDNVAPRRRGSRRPPPPVDDED